MTRLHAKVYMVALLVVVVAATCQAGRSAVVSREAQARYAIRLAASTFHVSERDMLRVARCESQLDPRAVNRSSGASGLFQFLPSTWRAQGMAGFSVFDPVANALAAARIVAREGWRQWVCRP